MSVNNKKSSFQSLLPNQLTATHNCCPENSKPHKPLSCNMHDFPGHFSSVIDDRSLDENKETRTKSMPIHSLSVKKDCGCGK